MTPFGFSPADNFFIHPPALSGQTDCYGEAIFRARARYYNIYNDIFRGNSVEDARAVKGRASRGGRGACRGLFGLFA